MERVRSLREGPGPYGRVPYGMAFHKKGGRGLREGLGPYGKPFTGRDGVPYGSLHREGRRTVYEG